MVPGAVLGLAVLISQSEVRMISGRASNHRHAAHFDSAMPYAIERSGGFMNELNRYLRDMTVRTSPNFYHDLTLLELCNIWRTAELFAFLEQ